VDEGIEQALIDAGEGAMNREALALETLRRGGDGNHGALHGVGARLGDPGESSDVVDGDGGHGEILSAAVTAGVGSRFQ
jgi:hypothetical protein